MTESPQPVTLTLDRLLRIKASDLPERAQNEIAALATHADPVWESEKRRGVQVEEDAHYLFSYRKSKDLQSLLLSRGTLSRVLAVLERHGLSWSISDERAEFGQLSVTFREGKKP